jgi:regulator of replication initiation timing
MPSTAFLDFDETLAVDIRVSQLEARLERERGRCSGLENGLSALSDRVTVLREENARLRERLALAGIDPD